MTGVQTCALPILIYLAGEGDSDDVIGFRVIHLAGEGDSDDVIGFCVIYLAGEGDSDDMSAGSSVSRESSPSASPFQPHHQTLVASLSAVELDRAVDDDAASKSEVTGVEPQPVNHELSGLLLHIHSSVSCFFTNVE